MPGRPEIVDDRYLKCTLLFPNDFWRLPRREKSTSMAFARVVTNFPERECRYNKILQIRK